MKRKIAMLLACFLAVTSILAGCGNSSSSSSGSEAAGTESGDSGSGDASGEDTSSAETEHIIVTYLYAVSEPSDLEKIQDAVNEITIPAINVEVEFMPLGMGDSFTNYSLWISSGETVDLMMLAFQDIKTYTNSGQIEPLDDLITAETAPTLTSLAEQFPILTTVQGVTYGLTPVGINYGDKPGMIIRTEYLEETGLEKDGNYTIDELTEIWAAIHENHPECNPAGILNSSVLTGGTVYSLLVGCDFPGANVLAGALMDTSSTEVVNLFETDEYKDFLQTVADWYEAGYIVPDAATTDSSGTELMMNGKVAGYPMSQKPEQFGAGYGFDVMGMPTGDAYIGAVNSQTNWVIPITSEHPDAAVKFMDYLYGHSELSNLIQWGIEGEHYNVVDEENGVIEFANDYTETTSPYYNSLGFWGDRRTELTFDASNTHAEHDAFTEEAMSNRYQDYGFVFDSSSVSNQLLSCQSVLDQYQKALETASLGASWEDTYNTMVSQLQTAGISDIIAECQSQLDAFLAE